MGSTKTIIWTEIHDSDTGLPFYLGRVDGKLVAEIHWSEAALSEWWGLHGCHALIYGFMDNVPDAKAMAEYAWRLVGVDP